MRTYSKILLNENYPQQWHLYDPILDGKIPDGFVWELSRGERLDVKNIVIHIYEGTVERLDWNIASINSLPVISYLVWEVIGPMIKEDVQAFPCCVKGVEEEFLLLNLLHEIDCIDEERSIVRYVSEDQKAFDRIHRPHAPRKYADVSNLHIDSSKIGDHRLFRTKYWPSEIIRNDVRDAFLAAGFKGPKFDPV